MHSKLQKFTLVKIVLFLTLLARVLARDEPHWTRKTKVPSFSPSQPNSIKRKDRCWQRQGPRDDKNPPVTNQLLSKAIREYEVLHSNAFRRESITEALHRHVTLNSDIINRYLIYSASSSFSGLGNRTLALISAFLLAILTDRILLVDFVDYSIDEILYTPFPNSDWVLPGTVKWKIINSTMRNGPSKINLHLPTEGSVKMVQLELNEKNSPNQWQGLACKDFKDLNNVQILHVIGNQYFSPILFANPVFSKTLASWFPDGNVASVLAAYLLHPRDYIWKNILETLKKSEGSPLRSGLQVRFLTGSVNMKAVEKAVTCLDNFGPQQHVLVASLYSDVSKYLYEHRLWNITHRYADQVQMPGKYQAARALHDAWVLSSCEELVITKRSTLGYLAGILRARPFTFLARPGEEGICSPSKSHEPCLHRPIDLNSDFCQGFGGRPSSTTAPLYFDKRIFIPCEDTIGIKLKIHYH